MTGNGLSRRLNRSFLLCAFAIVSCATSQNKGSSSDAAPDPDMVAIAASSPPAAAVSGGAQGSLDHSQVLDGSIVVVAVTLPEGADAKTLTGHFEKIEFPFYPVGSAAPRNFEAVLGVPHSHDPGPTEVVVNFKSTRAGEIQHLKIPFTVIDGHYKSEELHVDPRRVDVSDKTDQKRAIREAAEVGKIYNKTTYAKLWNGPFVVPIESETTSPFGTKRMFNGKMQRFHTGLDFRAKEGTPIRAPAGGKVVLAKNLFFTGNTVILDHGYGVFTIYAHMSKFKVKKGALVQAKQILGLSGKTGRVTGPHLHWQAVIQKQKVNPFDLTKVMR